MVKQAEVAADLVRQENIDRILESAERLFRHYGYTKTNVADIARDLGMSSANIYRFFPSKSAIHQALAERMLDDMYRSFVNIFNQKLSACEKLHLYAESNHKYTFEMMTSDKKVHEMVVVAMEQHWPVVETYMDKIQLLLKSAIRQGIDAGEFPEQDENVAARCFCACIAQLSHPVLVAQFTGDSREPSVWELVQFAIHSLKYGALDKPR